MADGDFGEALGGEQLPRLADVVLDVGYGVAVAFAVADAAAV